MKTSEICGIRIAGIAAAVSNNWTSLLELEVEEKQSVIEKFIKKTGVQGRYNAEEHQTSSDFCYEAAKRLLEEKKVNPEDIGILVFVTQTADYRVPATACVLQKRLGLSKDCLAFDVNLGCSGFTCGVNIVSSLLHSSSATMALLLAGDTPAKERSSKFQTKTTHSAGMLFGDAGTATLFVKENNCEPIQMASKTDGEGFRAIIAPYGGWRNPDFPSISVRGTTMDDVAVFNFAVNEVPELLKQVMEKEQQTPEDYDCLVLHQANMFIIKQVAKRTGFSMEKVPISLDKFGNTSCASIPLTLVKEYGQDKENSKLHVLACGFGIGLSWSTVDCFVNTADILPLIHTEEYFVDGYSNIE